MRCSMTKQERKRLKFLDKKVCKGLREGDSCKYMEEGDADEYLSLTQKNLIYCQRRQIVLGVITIIAGIVTIALNIAMLV